MRLLDRLIKEVEEVEETVVEEEEKDELREGVQILF